MTCNMLLSFYYYSPSCNNVIYRLKIMYIIQYIIILRRVPLSFSRSVTYNSIVTKNNQILIVFFYATNRKSIIIVRDINLRLRSLGWL